MSMHEQQRNNIRYCLHWNRINDVIALKCSFCCFFCGYSILFRSNPPPFEPFVGKVGQSIRICFSTQIHSSDCLYVTSAMHSQTHIDEPTQLYVGYVFRTNSLDLFSVINFINGVDGTPQYPRHDTGIDRITDSDKCVHCLLFATPIVPFFDWYRQSFSFTLQ